MKKFFLLLLLAVSFSGYSEEPKYQECYAARVDSYPFASPGKYTVYGKVLFFSVDQHGPFEIEYDGLHLNDYFYDYKGSISREGISYTMDAYNLRKVSVMGESLLSNNICENFTSYVDPSKYRALAVIGSQLERQRFRLK